MSTRLVEDMLVEAQRLMDDPSVDQNPEKKAVLLAHLRAQPDVLPYFIDGMKRRIEEDALDRGRKDA